MVKLIFETAQGQRREVDARAGDNIMFTAVSHGVDGIVGECGGAAMCATCHVYLDPAFAAVLTPKQEIETEMLDCAAAEVTGASRLGCQVQITPEMEGMVVRLPEAQY
ncbi:2Fe-2S iron-sulfur cluster-binding protein [Celeribacter neptunius]|uniref:Ferredoxin, 2Fe-2S n=1 Tax=Celeribacter neptunius TaxID=588602 RepID=A0A1I3V9L7_9RHOB|nr:2Fe-2S iron-sulfur cluster-binding protein [Celeribacter neptunius]SFJ90821.1 ferredoxin, 2Fe-2S [Celeribacter neptunius]